MNAQAQETADEGTTSAKAAPPETVEMEDGRKVEFAGKRKLLKEVLIEGDAVRVRFDFRSGKTLTWEVPGNLLLQCAGHGASQKIGDETAGEKDVGDMYEAVVAIIDRLDKGEWKVEREGGGFAGQSVLLQALLALATSEGKVRTVEDVRAYLKDKDQATKIALRNSPKVKPFVEKIEAEKAAKGKQVDVASVLEGL